MSNYKDFEKKLKEDGIVKACFGDYVVYRRDWLRENIEQEYTLQKAAKDFRAKFGIDELKRLIEQERKDAEKEMQPNEGIQD